MSLKFIDIDQESPNGSKHGSTFIIHPEGLQILGVLHHSQQWRPRTARDRDKLVTWLQGLFCDSCQTMRPGFECKYCGRAL